MEQAELESFLKAFNAGYTLQTHEPAVASSLCKTFISPNLYVQGLACGMEEAERELNKEQEFAEVRNRQQNIDKDINR